MWKDTDLCEKKPRSSLVSSNERRVVWSRRRVTRNSESQFHVRLTPLQGFTKHTKLRKQHKHGRAVVIRPWENITIKVAQEPTWLGGNEGNLSTTPQCGTGGRSCHGSKVHPGRCCQSSLTRKPWGRAQRLHLQTLAPQRVVETPLDKVRPRQPLVYTSCPEFVACQWTKHHCFTHCLLVQCCPLSDEPKTQGHNCLEGADDILFHGWLICKVPAKQKVTLSHFQALVNKIRNFSQDRYKGISIRRVFPLVKHLPHPHRVLSLGYD